MIPVPVIVLTIFIVIVIFVAAICQNSETIGSVNINSEDHNGNFRIAQKEGVKNYDTRVLQAETKDGWKNVKVFNGEGNIPYGGGWFLVEHNPDNIQWYADSALEDYKKYRNYRDKTKTSPIYLKNKE